jgi:3-hydroxyisobutyrate dehydrogenase-like beta-hydroxyacid dehydrogenase
MRTIGILGTGDMGSAAGAVLGRAGYRVVTALDGRSAASRALADRAGLEDLGSVERLIGESELLLSILPPAAAPDFAAGAAAIIRAHGRRIVYADCNAVSPATVRRIEALFADGPARFVDVGIVGPAPKPGTSSPTRFYASGRDRQTVLGLDAAELTMIDMGDRVGRASALKMCYAAMNKGTDALYANLMLAARRLGVQQELMHELETSQAGAASRIVRRVPFLAATAERFTGEMAEIAATFDAAGVSGDFYRGAEWLFSLLARSALAAETRATQPAERSLDEALGAYAAALEEMGSEPGLSHRVSEIGSEPGL